MIYGAAAFIIFALVLEQLIHLIVFKTFPLKEKPLIYILYGIFMAGIFEETARFISFKILKKKYAGIETGLSYGIGHGGIEAVLLAGVPMITAVVFSILINTGNAETITGKLQGEALTQMETQITAGIITTAPYMFLISGVERVFAITIQISLSVLVFYSVYSKGKIWLFPLAILLHAIIDIPAAAMQVNVLKNVLLVECIVGLCAILITIFALLVHIKLKKHD
jgi:uncharacterized membrane protein YhfC